MSSNFRVVQKAIRLYLDFRDPNIGGDAIVMGNNYVGSY